MSYIYIFFQGPRGDHNVERCLKTVEKFVMKPQREGGGMLTTAKRAYHLDLFDVPIRLELTVCSFVLLIRVAKRN